MNSLWYKDCKTDAERKERKELVNSAKPTLKVLRKVLDGLLMELESERSNKKLLYESPAWAYIQADNNGAVRAVKQVLSLLDQEEK